jgi:hypothetical protein
MAQTFFSAEPRTLEQNFFARVQLPIENIPLSTDAWREIPPANL